MYRASYNQGTQLCGQGSDWNEEVVNLKLEAEHTGLSVTIEFTTNLNENAQDESWGVRDFALFVSDAPPPATEFEVPEGFHTIGTFFTQFYLTEEDVKGWKLTGNKGVVSECGGKYIIGGFRNFGAGATLTRTFTGIAKHDKLFISL